MEDTDTQRGCNLGVILVEKGIYMAYSLNSVLKWKV